MSPERNIALERPLKPRSLIASLLLRSQPPRMRGARLVQWCGLFGVAEGTARVALSRMVERGELRAQDGVYELAGRVQQRQAAQDWSLAPTLGAWNGDWRFGVVRDAGRPADERAALRDAMRHLHYAELRAGLWARPDNVPRAVRDATEWEVADAECDWWSARPQGDAESLAVEAFALPAWETRAAALAAQLTKVTAGLERAGDRTLARAFVIGATALAHVRADPLLPEPLADPAPAAALRSAYADYEAAFTGAVRRWFLAS